MQAALRSSADDARRGEAAVRNKEPSGNRHNTGLRRRAIPPQIPAATGQVHQEPQFTTDDELCQLNKNGEPTVHSDRYQWRCDRHNYIIMMYLVKISSAIKISRLAVLANRYLY